MLLAGSVALVLLDFTARDRIVAAVAARLRQA